LILRSPAYLNIHTSGSSVQLSAIESRADVSDECGLQASTRAFAELELSRVIRAYLHRGSAGADRTSADTELGKADTAYLEHAEKRRRGVPARSTPLRKIRGGKSRHRSRVLMRVRAESAWGRPYAMIWREWTPARQRHQPREKGPPSERGVKRRFRRS
jgi:hypothetical protein